MRVNLLAGPLVSAVAGGVVLGSLAWLAISAGMASQPGLDLTVWGLAFAGLAWLAWGRGSWLAHWRWAPSTILLTGLALRLLFLAYPAGDDLNRYVWEGYLQRAGGNPYTQAPANFSQAWAGHATYDGINHPELPSLYPPVAMLVFRGLATLGPDLRDHPAGATRVFRWAFALGDGLLLWLLAAWLRRLGKPAHWLVLYSWNPLVLVYGAGEAHLDVLQSLLLVAALLSLGRDGPWAGLGYAMLGAAILSKFGAVVLLPFVVTRGNCRWLWALALPALAYWPFGGLGDGSLWHFASTMHHNDFLPRLLRVVHPALGQPLVLAGVLGLGLLVLWLCRPNAGPALLAPAWMWYLLCLPTVHPWYLLGLAALLTVAPSGAGFLLQVTMGLQVLVQTVHQQTGVWREPGWLPWLIWLPPLALWAWERRHLVAPGEAWLPPAKTWDIIIPTLNEASHLPNTLASINTAREQLEEVLGQGAPRLRLLVVDAGSQDGTADLAAGFGATVLHAAYTGRGHQQAAGFRQGAGDLVILLHADARLQPDALLRLARALHRHPALQWGILGHHYDQRPWQLRLVELSNRLRFHLLGIAFGDQGIFARREVLHAAGGIPLLPLMEDVELSLRLGPFPARLSLGASLVVSSRRWRLRGFSTYTWQVLRLVSWYLLARRLGQPIEQTATRLYQAYYRRAAVRTPASAGAAPTRPPVGDDP